MKQRLVQLRATLLYSLSLKGFTEVSIYRGRPKGLYVPGSNYYSCPGTVGSCPLDTPQNALSAMDRKLPFYILEVLLLLGVTMGRTIYDSLCPSGPVQELLYRVPVPKIKKNRVTQELPKVKYMILTVFIITLPVISKIASGLPVPTFCKYICPTGTPEGGIPLMFLDDSLGSLVGTLFHWKALMLAVTLVNACFLHRSSCYTLCSLGAVYSLFVPVALLGVRTNRDTCVDCGRCVRTYKMDVGQVGDRECIQCGECVKECNVNAIYQEKPWDVRSKK